MQKIAKAATMSFVDGGYFGEAFKSAAELCSNAERTLRGLEIDFDSMVAIGLSGHMVLPLLARHFNVPFLALRKPGTYTHDDYGIGKFGRGTIGRRWILVDDFICSGNTVRTAQQRIAEALDFCRERGYDSTFSTEFAGTYCYGKRYGDPEAGSFVYPDMVTKKGVTGIMVDGTEQYVDSQAYGRMRSQMLYYRQRGSVDPKGETVTWFRKDCADYERPFNLAEATKIAVAVERFLIRNPHFED